MNGLLTIFRTIVVSRVTYTRCLPGMVNCPNDTLVVLKQSFAAHTSGNSPTITIFRSNGTSWHTVVWFLRYSPSSRLHQQLLPALILDSYDLCEPGHPYKLPSISTSTSEATFHSRCFFRFVWSLWSWSTLFRKMQSPMHCLNLLLPPKKDYWLWIKK